MTSHNSDNTIVWMVFCLEESKTEVFERKALFFYVVYILSLRQLKRSFPEKIYSRFFLDLTSFLLLNLWKNLKLLGSVQQGYTNHGKRPFQGKNHPKKVRPGPKFCYESTVSAATFPGTDGIRRFFSYE